MKKLALLAMASLVLVSCRSGRGAMAMASLNPSQGNAAKGTVHFQDQGDGTVEVVVDLTNVPPGVHGFHVHEKGDCGNNGQNAGAHFNPTNTVHGAQDALSASLGCGVPTAVADLHPGRPSWTSGQAPAPTC